MKKIMMQALAKAGDVLEVTFSKDFYIRNQKSFVLYEDGIPLRKLLPVSQSESGSSYLYTLFTKGVTYLPGHIYQIKTTENYFIPIDISFLAMTPAFEEKYRFDGPLGALYQKDKTTFRVFSPFATSIVLKLQRKGEYSFRSYVMERNDENGIFETTVEGDLDESRYCYSAKIFGEINDVVDPYAFGLGHNSLYGYVIDPKKVYRISTDDNQLPPYRGRQSSIIYECNVRDMTSLSDIEDKDTYEALSRDGLKTKGGLPMGLDYLSSLGVTHIQLQPVLDFRTIDDDDPSSSYNWGYDPAFYFAPEGSYTKNPDDPYERIVELRSLVGAFHRRGLRVVFDVVYNHVFSHLHNSLSLLVPQYYFRHNNDGTLSNGSGCGNDLESRHYMCRKLIIDSLLHLVDFYAADGFRFDLMGITDIETMKKAYEEVEEKKKDVLFYGEGWDLWTNLPADEKATQYNSSKMPFAAFFNDRFRDVVKGKTGESELGVKGYLSGDTNYRDGFKHVFLGSSVALAFAPMFKDAGQSLNYVECHDNHTLYDKLKRCCPEESDAELFRRIKMITVAILTSCGIPFFHAGQEIGLSKGGIGNSYDAGDKVNGFDWKLLDERKSLYYFFRDAISICKRMEDLIGDQREELGSLISFENLPYGAIKVNYNLKDFSIYILFNPTKHSFTYSFDDYSQLIFNETGNVEKADFYVKLAIVNGLSVSIYLSRRENK